MRPISIKWVVPLSFTKKKIILLSIFDSEVSCQYQAKRFVDRCISYVDIGIVDS